MRSVAYYPLIRHSIVSQIHTVPDYSSCTTSKPEKQHAMCCRTDEQAPALSKAQMVVPQLRAGSLHVLAGEHCQVCTLRENLFSVLNLASLDVIKTTADTLEQVVKPLYHLWELFYSDQLETAGNRACDLAEGNKTVPELLNVMLTPKLLEASSSPEAWEVICCLKENSESKSGRLLAKLYEFVPTFFLVSALGKVGT